MKKKIFVTIILSLLLIVFLISNEFGSSNTNNKSLIETYSNLKFNGSGENAEVINVSIKLDNKDMTVGGGTFRFVENQYNLREVTYYSYDIVLEGKADSTVKIPLYSGSSSGDNLLELAKPRGIGTIAGPRNKLLSDTLLDNYKLFFVLEYGNENRTFAIEKIELKVVN